MNGKGKPIPVHLTPLIGLAILLYDLEYLNYPTFKRARPPQPSLMVFRCFSCLVNSPLWLHERSRPHRWTTTGRHGLRGMPEASQPFSTPSVNFLAKKYDLLCPSRKIDKTHNTHRHLSGLSSFTSNRKLTISIFFLYKREDSQPFCLRSDLIQPTRWSCMRIAMLSSWVKQKAGENLDKSRQKKNSTTYPLMSALPFEIVLHETYGQQRWFFELKRRRC